MKEKNLSENYLEYLEKVLNFTYHTLRCHKRVCRQWKKFLITERKCRITKAIPEDLLTWIEYRRTNGLQDVSITKELCVLRRLYQYLENFGKMRSNPAASLPEIISRPSSEQDYLTVEECFKLLDTFDRENPLEFRNYVMVALLWSTGLRSSELCGLDWRDINLQEATLLVRRGKGRKQRQIFLNERLIDIMRKHQVEQGGTDNTPVFRATRINAPGAEKGTRLSEHRLVEIIHKHGLAAGLTKSVCPLSLRHSFATHMFEAAVNIDDIKEIMGHTQETETTVYVHVTIAAIKRLLNGPYLQSVECEGKDTFMKTTISVDDYDAHIEDWLKLRETITSHQASTIKSNRRDVELLSRYLHEQRIGKITGEALLAFLAYVRQQRNNGPGALNRKEASIRSYIRYLRFRQVDGAKAFPIEYLPRAREPYSGPIDVLEPLEVSRLLQSIDKDSVLGVRDFLLYSLLYRLGLRIGEAVSIDLNDINLQKGIVRIHGKGRRERTLPLISDMPMLIEFWVALRQKIRSAMRLNALFLSKKGHRLSVRTAEENFQKIVAAAGPFSLQKVTPHSLRHAFASHSFDEDATDTTLVVLKSVLGHAVMQSTQVYMHPSIRILRKAVNDHPASEILQKLIKTDALPLRVHQRRKATSALAGKNRINSSS